MREKMTRLKALLIAALLADAMILLPVAAMLLPVSALSVNAQEDDEEDSEENEAQDHYNVYLDDSADLLTDSEEEELYEVMQEGTGYGNMVFMTIDEDEGYSSKDYIEMVYQTSPVLEGTNAVVYLIDMDNRMLWITGYKGCKKEITPDYGNLITDNVYRYAKSGDYGKCAIQGYRQIIRKLSGDRVAGALRGVGNLCIAVIIAEILCFAWAYLGSAARKTGDDEILDNIERNVDLRNPSVKKTGRRRIYDPPSKSSGSSGGSYGGGGGGGFHGGGGGHGF